MNKSQNSKPPQSAECLLSWFIKGELLEEILGDLYEYHEELLDFPKWKRTLFYWFHVFHFLRPFAIRKTKLLTQNSMWKNYFKMAFRIFRKEKAYSLINISGLTLGITCCLLIYLFIRDELSFDKFHKDGDNIYRVSAAYMRAGKWEPYATNSWKTAELLKANFQEFERMVKIGTRSEIVTYRDKVIEEDYLATVDDDFFKTFSFPLLMGNPDNVLKGVSKVVISESIAEKYFADENPIGKIFKMTDGQYSLQVTGIMKDMPPNSHFRFDFLISGETNKKISSKNMLTNVGWDSQYIYVKLADHADSKAIESRFPDFVNTHLTSQFSGFTSNTFKLFLQPLPEIHLKSNIGNELQPNGNINHVYGFSAIAIFILIIACINYMNLTTARSLRRAAEVGVRKVLGANKSTLTSQFLTESLLMTFAAMLLAIGLSILILPYFNSLSGKAFTPVFLLDTNLLIVLFSSLIAIGLISGAYPSFVLSSLKPLSTLKGNHVSGMTGATMRKGLVVVQFVISIGLIASSGIVFQQVEFMNNKDLGYDKDFLVTVPLRTMDRKQLNAFKNELLSNNAVLKAGTSNMKMPGWIGNTTFYKAQEVQQDEDARQSMKIIRVDYDFLNTAGIEIANGRAFSNSFMADSVSSVVINESAVMQLGWKEPLGKWIELDDKKYNVVGVVKDFHFESLHRKIPPTIFKLSSDWLNWAYLRIDGQNIPSTLEHIESVYSQFVTNRDFLYFFTNEDVQRQYESEDKFVEIFTIFTGLAIFIACLGTFGLISFTAERKSKEIGIRKVLGASVSNLSFLLIKEFVILLLIASLIAWPVTFYLIGAWVDGFLYRINIGPESFILATCFALFIAVGTTGFRAVKAALMNPVDSLRDE